MKLLVTLGAFLFSGVIAATPLHNIVVFGDSLSDNGNLYEFMQHQLPQSPPYFEGRFTNGPVWVEHLAASYFPNDPKAHLFDYAFGGAGVSEEGDDDVLFTLRKEVNTYLKEHNDKASADSLYVVWIGANNYLAMPSEVEQTLTDVNTGIVHSLERLADKGAKQILVLNIPDLGRTPAATEFGSIDAFTYFSKQHNLMLDSALARLKEKYPDVKWLFFDMNTVFTALLENPADYGFTNTSNACANSMPNSGAKPSILNIVENTKSIAGDEICPGYLFFDLVHPTALAHKILSEKARIMLDEAGIEFIK